VPSLNRAFADKAAKGVILLINSPGGSPVQASIIHDKIEQLKKKYHKKVIEVGEDTRASGAYLVATAADKIYVNSDTITGSIGVIMNGFGFADTIKKLGITRRVFTAGTNKDRMDPFLPLNPVDTTKIHKVLNAVHQNFINDVLAGRKGKLHGDQKELFSGDFWTGQQATQLGLVDGTANLWTVMQDQFGVQHYKSYSARPSIIQMLTRGIQSQLHLGLSNSTTPIQAIAQY
jgi:protease-4